MAPAPPRFVTFFLSGLTSEKMLIPDSFYDDLPLLLPQTVSLQNSRGIWNVAMMMETREYVYLGQGWGKFAKDNSLRDGEFMTFVYDDEERAFEVGIYGRDGCKKGCKKTRAVTEVVEIDDEENSIYSVSSNSTSDSESNDTITVPRNSNKGKEKEEVVESSDEDSDYVEAEESSNSDKSYTTPKKRVRPRLIQDLDAIADGSSSAAQKREWLKEERKNLSFFKIFRQSADLSSEVMRALPYNFTKKIAEEDFSHNVVIRAQCGSSWKVNIDKDPMVYHFEEIGWNQFVSDNVLGQDEFVTFTHKGKMHFHVNFFHPNGKEIIKPRMPPTMTSPRGIMKKPGESSGYKGVKKEKKSNKKNVTFMETSESSRAKKNKIDFNNVKMGLPEFKITIRISHLTTNLPIPSRFKHLFPKESKMFVIHHPSMRKSWKVGLWFGVTRTRTRAAFTLGWIRAAREYPLVINKKYTFKLIEPTEILILPDYSRINDDKETEVVEIDDEETEVVEIDDEENSIYSISSNTTSDSESNDTSSGSDTITVPRNNNNKGKEKEDVVESSDEDK